MKETWVVVYTIGGLCQKVSPYDWGKFIRKVGKQVKYEGQGGMVMMVPGGNVKEFSSREAAEKAFSQKG